MFWRWITIPTYIYSYEENSHWNKETSPGRDTGEHDNKYFMNSNQVTNKTHRTHHQLISSRSAANKLRLFFMLIVRLLVRGWCTRTVQYVTCYTTIIQTRRHAPPLTRQGEPGLTGVSPLQNVTQRTWDEVHCPRDPLYINSSQDPSDAPSCSAEGSPSWSSG